MRVGYILKRYPRFSETFIINEILAHEAAGVDVEIFSLRSPNDPYFQDLLGRVRAPVTYIPEAAKAAEFWDALTVAAAILPSGWNALASITGAEAQDVFQAVLLARETSARRIDHLHAHFASIATSVTLLAARLTGRTYTFTAHAKDVFHRDVGAEDLHRKLAEAAATVTVSDYNRTYLRRLFPDAAARVHRIYNGLDLTQFSYTPPMERAARILAVGRLVEKKGFADLVEACALLDRRGRHFECIIVGAGEEETNLQLQIHRLGLLGTVVLAGAYPRSEVAEYYRRSAVVAAPCVVGSDGNQDGLPTVLIEAMALGTPCISTDVGGIPELLDDGRTGLLVPQHDPPALAAALERLLGDADLRARLSRSARDLIERDFDVHCNAAQLRTLFVEAQAARAKPRRGVPAVPVAAEHS